MLGARCDFIVSSLKRTVRRLAHLSAVVLKRPSSFSPSSSHGRRAFTCCFLPLPAGRNCLWHAWSLCSVVGNSFLFCSGAVPCCQINWMHGSIVITCVCIEK